MKCGKCTMLDATHLRHDNDHLRHFKEKERGMKKVVNASRIKTNVSLHQFIKYTCMIIILSKCCHNLVAEIYSKYKNTWEYGNESSHTSLSPGVCQWGWIFES